MAVAAAVEAVGAYLALGHADALYEVFNLGELQAGESQATPDFLNHTLVFGRVGSGILLERLGCFLLAEVADDAAGDEFIIAL